jgi:hypothetical protein
MHTQRSIQQDSCFLAKNRKLTHTYWLCISHNTILHFFGAACTPSCVCKYRTLGGEINAQFAPCRLNNENFIFNLFWDTPLFA